MKGVIQAMSDDQDFNALLTTIVKKGTRKAVNAGSEKKDRHRRFTYVLYNT